MQQLEPQQLKQSAVCLWDTSKHEQKPKGAGVLISDQHILTCAHAVQECLIAKGNNEAKNPLQESINLTFPFSKETKNYKARVIFYQEPHNQSGDVACLQLLASKPVDTKPATFYVASELWGQEFRIFGFPQPYDEGVWASGEFRDEAASGWIQVDDKQQGRGIRQGFSGSGVWHSELGCIVGIMSAATTVGKTAFLIPTPLLVKLWNKLPVLEKSQLKKYELNLPSLPKSDLPEQPFQDLNYFSKAHAEIFFGRNDKITELYQHLIKTDSTPINLLYGQSGVGKSSFLAAGLLPRLEAGDGKYFPAYQVLYVRRSQNKGVLGSLLNALKVTEPTKVNLRTLWQHKEAAAAKPLIIVIDQLEEIYTQPITDLGKNNNLQQTVRPSWSLEMNELKQALEKVFTKSENRPKGKLLLSFRKEWLAEIEKELTQSNLPSTKKFFLEPLDYENVLEIIAGITRNERLRNHYNLTIEEGLAESIARDLLRDVGSSLAPTLQILLTKMWNKAKESSRSNPTFSLALYEELRAKGILLDDFLAEQFESIRKWQAAPIDSGLVLDILEYHTTSIGTADYHSAVELKKIYDHCNYLYELVNKLKEHYLLTDLGKEETNDKNYTRLTHDILALLIRKHFATSNKLGQRARRILESHMLDQNTTYQHRELWSSIKLSSIKPSSIKPSSIKPSSIKPSAAFLTKHDLQLVRKGKDGMRKWTEAEEKLVKKSFRQIQRNEFFNLLISNSILVGIFYTILRYFTFQFIGSDPRNALGYFFWGMLLGASISLGGIVNVFGKMPSKTLIKNLLIAGCFSLVTVIMSLINSPDNFLSSPFPPTIASVLIGIIIAQAINQQDYSKKILYTLLAIFSAAFFQWCLLSIFNFPDGLIFAWGEQFYSIGEFSYLTHLSLMDTGFVILIIVLGVSLRKTQYF